MRILLTNDDGFESPLLHVLVDRLVKESWLTELDILVPSTEQSWIGTAVNKRGTKNITQRTINGQVYHLVNGSPGDCISIACAGFCEQKPDIILSGINFGVNAGVCFYLSSGTVAGARQAALFNIPGVSLSAELSREIYDQWNQRDFEGMKKADDFFNEIAEVQVGILSKLIKDGIFSLPAYAYSDRALKVRKKVDFISINTPRELKEDNATYTRLEPNRFQAFYRKISDTQYEHSIPPGFFAPEDHFESFSGDTTSAPQFASLSHENVAKGKIAGDSALMTDVQALSLGKNSVTLFDVDSHGELFVPL